MPPEAKRFRERRNTLLGATSPLLGATSPLLGATSPLLGATSPLLGATSPLLGASSLLLGGPGAVHRGRVVLVMNGALLGATSLLRWAPGAVINLITQGRRRSTTREIETWSGLGIMLATPAGSARFL